MSADEITDRQRHGQGDRPGIPLREMLENGTHEFAAAEKINETYVMSAVWCRGCPIVLLTIFRCPHRRLLRESASINEPQQIPKSNSIEQALSIS